MRGYVLQGLLRVNWMNSSKWPLRITVVRGYPFLAGTKWSAPDDRRTRTTKRDGTPGVSPTRQALRVHQSAKLRREMSGESHEA